MQGRGIQRGLGLEHVGQYPRVGQHLHAGIDQIETGDLRLPARLFVMGRECSMQAHTMSVASTVMVTAAALFIGGLVFLHEV